MSLTDDEIVAHFIAHPQENGAGYASELYYGGHLTHDAAIALSQDMCRVKKILVKYSTDLMLRRAQIRDSSDQAAADEYLRDQLYLQAGQKL